MVDWLIDWLIDFSITLRTGCKVVLHIWRILHTCYKDVHPCDELSTVSLLSYSAIMMTTRTSMVWWTYVWKRCDEPMCGKGVMNLCVEKVWWTYVWKRCDEPMCGKGVMNLCVEKVWWTYVWKRCDEPMCGKGVMNLCVEKVWWTYV